MSSHFPLPKIRPFRFSLHTSRLSFFLNGHHCGAEIRNEFTFSVAKKFRPHCSDSLKWRELRNEWSKTKNKWSNPTQSYVVLPIEKMNQIYTKNYWK